MTPRAKKSLGQNFLHDRRAISKLATTADISGKTVVEVGPGTGAITTQLLEQAAQVIAIETDAKLVAHLQEKFADACAEKKLILLSEDMRTFAVETLRQYTDAYTVVANIPYYLSGFLLRTFVSAEFQPEELVFLVQKEVGERVVQKDGKTSILSLSVAAYGAPRIAGRVSRRAFSPPPAVDSVILHITDISRKRLQGIDEELFFMVVKTAFSQKRKQVVKTLQDMISPHALVSLLEAHGYPATARPEEIDITGWIYITKKVRYNTERDVARN